MEALALAGFAIFLCGMAAGYRWAWMDRYEQGRAEALRDWHIAAPPVRPSDGAQRRGWPGSGR